MFKHLHKTLTDLVDDRISPYSVFLSVGAPFSNDQWWLNSTYYMVMGFTIAHFRE